MGDLHVWLTIGGLVLISVLTRSFFFISTREWPFPDWLKTGLKYAPVGALCAVAVPAVLLPGAGAPLVSWGPRALAAIVAVGVAWWRKDMLLTIVVGMATYHVAMVFWGR